MSTPGVVFLCPGLFVPLGVYISLAETQSRRPENAKR